MPRKTTAITKAPSMPSPARDTGAALLGAARACFEQYGVHRTRMEDVARAAGVSRQLLYQHFASRKKLLDAVLDREVIESVEDFARLMPKRPTLERAILDTAVKGIQVLRARPLLVDLYRHFATREIHNLLHDSDRVMRVAQKAWWGPVIRRARESGELVSPLPDDEILSWLLSVYAMFLMQEEDMPPQRRIYLLRSFVLPVLINKKKP